MQGRDGRSFVPSEPISGQALPQAQPPSLPLHAVERHIEQWQHAMFDADHGGRFPKALTTTKREEPQEAEMNAWARATHRPPTGPRAPAQLVQGPFKNGLPTGPRGQIGVVPPAYGYGRNTGFVDEAPVRKDVEGVKEAVKQNKWLFRPMASFCCGCYVKYGVAMIVAINLAVNLFYLGRVFTYVILQIPGSKAGLAMQVYVAIWCFTSIPFNMCGLYGVYVKCEVALRSYLGYYVFSVVVDIGCLLFNVFTNDPCANIRRSDAALCGILMIVTAGSAVLFIGFQVYFCFTIWAYCTELKGYQSRGMCRLLRTATAAKAAQTSSKAWCAQHGHGYGAAMAHHM